jgi:Cu(I)/Ag(I) efflux system membrane protein CusA/SilA
VAEVATVETVEGRERYPVNMRFPREQRDDVEKLRDLPIVTPTPRHAARLGRVVSPREARGP